VEVTARGSPLVEERGVPDCGPFESALRDVADARFAWRTIGPCSCSTGSIFKVRMAKRVVAVPVLAALCVTETGQKRLVALQLAASEATTAWSGLLTDLQRRGLPASLLVVTDGHAGLKKALEGGPMCASSAARPTKGAVSPMRVVPRGSEAGLPRIICADDGLGARAAYEAFVKKWTTLCPAVAHSIKEAALICSPSTISPRRCGSHCARRPRSKTSIVNSVHGRRRKSFGT